MTLLKRIKSKFRILKQYGLKHSIQRVAYTLKHAIGFTSLHGTIYLPSAISRSEWFNQKSAFIIANRKVFNYPQESNLDLQTKVEKIFAGTYPYFQTLEFESNAINKWHFNPLSGHIYSKAIHWSKISDFSASEGDIKFVWELSRFCYLYQIMRYDYHFGKDSSEFVFKEILDWINENPIDRGPNYMSSQEIALRLLNWIYALHFYKDSSSLSDAEFNVIIKSIYLQTIHIEKELEFSKKFARNNHLLAESLALFTVGIQFPHLKESVKWKQKGYTIFCNEISFQFDDDGAYLQHSFNYQRAAMQLATWFLCLSNKNAIAIPKTVLTKLEKSIQFMLNMMGDPDSGRLPQFGNNDGSIFFPLNDCLYTNYYPQIQALANAMEIQIGDKQFEDSFWFDNLNNFEKTFSTQLGIINYNITGYYAIHEKNTMTFFWCPDFKHRPGQADMFHCDIWHNGENILCDNGTYLYNTTDVLRNFFFGSRSHNSIIIDGKDLMEKGERFIFFHWPKKLSAITEENNDKFLLKGLMQFYPQTRNATQIQRTIIKSKNELRWEIEDLMQNTLNNKWTQIWNITETFLERFQIIATDSNENSIQPVIVDSFTSADYGHIKAAQQIHFTTTTNLIHTIITEK